MVSAARAFLYIFHSPLCTWKINCSIFQGCLALWKNINYVPGRTGGIHLKVFKAVQKTHLTVRDSLQTTTPTDNQNLGIKIYPCDSWLNDSITEHINFNIHNVINDLRGQIQWLNCIFKPWSKVSTAVLTTPTSDDSQLEWPYIMENLI